MRFNEENGITPKGVSKRIKDIIDGVYDAESAQRELKVAQERAAYETMRARRSWRERSSASRRTCTISRRTLNSRRQPPRVMRCTACAKALLGCPPTIRSPPLDQSAFVCMGNICRSPTAEGVFRAQLRKHRLEGRIEVDSAGTHGYHVGEAPDPRTQRALLPVATIFRDFVRARWLPEILSISISCWQWTKAISKH